MAPTTLAYNKNQVATTHSNAKYTKKITSDPESLVLPTLYIHVIGANSTLVNSDFTTILSRLPLLPNLHVTFIGFRDSSDAFNDGEHESMFSKRCVWRERGQVSE